LNTKVRWALFGSGTIPFAKSAVAFFDGFKSSLNNSEKCEKNNFLDYSSCKKTVLAKKYIQGVSAKTFEPNNSVIFRRIFVKFKMQIF
jgi:hypothetical protein